MNSILPACVYSGSRTAILLRPFWLTAVLGAIIATASYWWCRYNYHSGGNLFILSIGIILGFWIALGYALLGVTLHEVGHWATLRMSQIACHKVSVGRGPALFKFFWYNTEWTLHAGISGGYAEEDQAALAALRQRAPRRWGVVIAICAASGPFLGASTALPLFCFAPGVDDMELRTTFLSAAGFVLALHLGSLLNFGKGHDGRYFAQGLWVFFRGK